MDSQAAPCFLFPHHALLPQGPHLCCLFPCLSPSQSMQRTPILRFLTTPDAKSKPPTQLERVPPALAGASSCAVCTGPPANGTFQQAAADTTLDACPWACNQGFYPQEADVNGPPPAACLQCTNAPPSSVYAGPGALGGGENCQWQCLPGYYRAREPQERCAPCPTGTYSTATGAAPHSQTNTPKSSG
jgi:hypothetical protein